jgi:DNA-binding transcriptional ArsR family regulator
MSVTAAKLDRIFRALANAPRREILRRVAAERRTVAELAEHFDMSLAAVAKHVHVLVAADLLDYEREGRVHWCRLKPKALDPVLASVEDIRTFWDARLDQLESLLTTEATERPAVPRRRKRNR